MSITQVEPGPRLLECLKHGSVMAWRFLAANNVPDHIILRVLSDPAKRRNAQAQSHSAAAR